LLNLPERDSKEIHRRHAELIANQLGVSLEVLDLSSILKEMGVYELLPISGLPGLFMRQATVRLGRSLLGLDRATSVLSARFRPEADSWVAYGNAYAMSKHRLRMIVLYKQAEISNLMVVGAANRTELMTGTFSQWGCDQCADVMPLVHLYRSQLYPLASFLGIPKNIYNKAADPDILPGVNDKEDLLGSFSDVDRVLMGLEMGIDQGSLVESYGAELVDRLVDLVELSRPMRESPYVLKRGE
jgi:NAD+ synthase